LGHYKWISDHFEGFAAVSLTQAKLMNYIEAIFPDPKRRTNQSDRSYEEALKRNDHLRSMSQRLCSDGKGNDQPAIRNTLWAAYNGVTELVDHYTDYSDPWKRLESVCLGEGQHIKQRAFDFALEFSKN
jgi:hypothetical protein